MRPPPSLLGPRSLSLPRLSLLGPRSLRAPPSLLERSSLRGPRSLRGPLPLSLPRLSLLERSSLRGPRSLPLPRSSLRGPRSLLFPPPPGLGSPHRLHSVLNEKLTLLHFLHSQSLSVNVFRSDLLLFLSRESRL